MAAVTIAPAFVQGSVLEDSWTTKAPMHQARSGLGVIAVDGKIYAIGGSTSGSLSAIGTNEQYNPTTDTWVYKAPMPTPRVYFATAAYQNLIYCIGGVNGERLVDERSGFYTAIDSSAVEVYDTTTDNWTIKPNMPKGGGMHMSAQEINGKIYVLDSPYIFVYDPVNDTWTWNDNLTLPRYSAVVGNKIVATNSKFLLPPSTHFGETVQQIFSYDPQSNNITQGSDSVVSVDAGGVCATAGKYAPLRVYVMGVKSNTSPNVPINLVYDPKTDSWATATALN